MKVLRAATLAFAFLVDVSTGCIGNTSLPPFLPASEGEGDGDFGGCEGEGEGEGEGDVIPRDTHECAVDVDCPAPKVCERGIGDGCGSICVDAPSLGSECRVVSDVGCEGFEVSCGPGAECALGEDGGLGPTSICAVPAGVGESCPSEYVDFLAPPLQDGCDDGLRCVGGVCDAPCDAARSLQVSTTSAGGVCADDAFACETFRAVGDDGSTGDASLCVRAVGYGGACRRSIDCRSPFFCDVVNADGGFCESHDFEGECDPAASAGSPSCPDGEACLVVGFQEVPDRVIGGCGFACVDDDAADDGCPTGTACVAALCLELACEPVGAPPPDCDAGGEGEGEELLGPPGVVCRDDDDCAGGVCGAGHRCFDHQCDSDSDCSSGTVCSRAERNGLTCGSVCEAPHESGDTCAFTTGFGCDATLPCYAPLRCAGPSQADKKDCTP